MMSAAVRSVVLGALSRGVPAWVLSGAALDFDFVNGRGFNSIDRAKLTPDSILTYTNPSAKMVYGSDGVLRYAPHNLLTYSEQFDNAAWTKSDVTVSANAIAAPNGTVTADQIVESATTAVHRALTAIFTLSAVPYTFSIRVKKNLTRRLYVNADTLMGVRSLFDLSAGTVVSTLAGSATIADIGNDYWLITVTGTGTGASNRVYLQINRASSGSAVDDNYAGDGASGIYVWGAQLNLGSSALTYIPTTTAAVYSLPIDHNPTTFAPLGVLIEEERKNLLQWSEQFDNAAWTKSQATVTANSAIAPDGTTTADTLLDTAVSNIHYISQTVTGSPSGVTYTVSAYLKASTLSYATIGLSDISSGSLYAVAVFNLSSGEVATSGAAGVGYSVTSSSITSVGNGWYRCVATVVAGTSVAFLKTVVGCNKTGVITGSAGGFESYLGNGSGIYVWGAQLEAGAFATSYIHTTNNPLGVTRLADQVSILTSAFAYNAAAGTFVVDANVRELSSGASGYFAACAGAGGNSDTHNLYRTSGSEQLQIRSGASTVALISPAGGSGSAKMAYAYAVDDYAISKNGGAVGSDPLGALPVGVDRVQIGTVAGANYANGPIKRLTYFPTRRTNADLQVLST